LFYFESKESYISSYASNFPAESTSAITTTAMSPHDLDTSHTASSGTSGNGHT